MKTCNKTIPSIVEGNSLYEAVCVIKNVAEKAIAEAGTTATAAEAAKAAAAAAQQTADQAHEEATNAAASAEQAGEKAQAAQTAADGAQQTANTASATANAAAVKVDKVISGDTVIGKYLVKETPAASPMVGDAVYVKNTGGDEVMQGVMPICVDPHDLQYITSQTTIAARRFDTGDVYVPETPVDDWAAASKKYVDTAVAAVAATPTTSLTGQTVLADENGAAISQITVQRIGISGFSGTLKKISCLDIIGEIATNYSENTSKKLSFDITGVLGDGGTPGSMGKIPINVFSGEKSHFTLAEFNATTGKLVIDCSSFDPKGGNVWKIFSQHAYYKT